MSCPVNAYEGDLFIDPVSDKIFYFTGDRWLDITNNSTKHQQNGTPIQSNNNQKHSC